MDDIILSLPEPALPVITQEDAYRAVSSWVAWELRCSRIEAAARQVVGTAWPIGKSGNQIAILTSALDRLRIEMATPEPK